MELPDDVSDPQWLLWALVPAPHKMIGKMIDTGRAHARAWAIEQRRGERLLQPQGLQPSWPWPAQALQPSWPLPMQVLSHFPRPVRGVASPAVQPGRPNLLGRIPNLAGA